MAVASILVGRLLGPEQYGQYTLAFVIPQLLFLFADFGMNQGIIKFTAAFRARGETGRIVALIRYSLLLRSAAGLSPLDIGSAVYQCPNSSYQPGEKARFWPDYGLGREHLSPEISLYL